MTELIFSQYIWNYFKFVILNSLFIWWCLNLDANVTPTWCFLLLNVQKFLWCKNVRGIELLIFSITSLNLIIIDLLYNDQDNYYVEIIKKIVEKGETNFAWPDGWLVADILNLYLGGSSQEDEMGRRCGSKWHGRRW